VSVTVPDPASTDWVPLFDLGRQPVKYLGQYNAGTTYNDGDVVVGPDGLTYICVADNTLGVTPSWSGVYPPWPPAYGTSLPTSPVNGQEAILVDSVTNPSYQWRFRYNANSVSTYKWEYIGGTPWVSHVASGFSSTALFTAFTTDPSGPRLTVPRSGEYFASIAATTSNSSPNAGSMLMAVIAGSARNESLAYTMTPGSPSGLAARANWLVDVALVAGQVIELGYGVLTAGSSGFDRRELSIYPKRVS
jgi:hypothetical protein